MFGIICCSNGIKCMKDDKENIWYVPLDHEELENHNELMREHGFIPNYEYDCYILDGYGAYMGNTDSEDLSEFYWSSFSNMGYDLVLGPKSCDDICGKYGVFCKNYEYVYKMNCKHEEKQEKHKILMKLSKTFRNI